MGQVMCAVQAQTCLPGALGVAQPEEAPLQEAPLQEVPLHRQVLAVQRLCHAFC